MNRIHESSVSERIQVRYENSMGSGDSVDGGVVSGTGAGRVYAADCVDAGWTGHDVHDLLHGE